MTICLVLATVKIPFQGHANTWRSGILLLNCSEQSICNLLRNASIGIPRRSGVMQTVLSQPRDISLRCDSNPLLTALSCPLPHLPLSPIQSTPQMRHQCPGFVMYTCSGQLSRFFFGIVTHVKKKTEF